MVNRIGTVYPWGSNKGFSSRFCVDSQVWHETPEEGWRTYQLQYYDYNNKDEVNSPNILSDNNYQATSQTNNTFIDNWPNLSLSSVS